MLRPDPEQRNSPRPAPRQAVTCLLLLIVPPLLLLLLLLLLLAWPPVVAERPGSSDHRARVSAGGPHRRLGCAASPFRRPLPEYGTPAHF
jgi:hypothetical protein